MGRSRYPVVPVERRTVDDIVFASGREAKRYAELKLLERAGKISNLSLQPAFLIMINGKILCHYHADFAYFENGDRVIEDVKSEATRRDAAYRLRKRAAELTYGFEVRETGI